ncbi:uncharacterized protein AMSG_08796 [Thecamonas trahens ATCC 50062]|uniref:Nucleoporin n=1 Tax=Thecamonas trahens ATCC 50062 TaxID=461836 RepID=A0A0L0DLW1_THETB|nr:hypothetical protein AMSG_08796 [Thecamonas trahens ATCC 50062]KNC53302.1 hypothetical protein AMSG_08796 [Thecamonas trahens ATCC 50062]|eukprot:XP_013754563.1 hypothetical protein AMSG_08796 [Thecamonas trahens ATCC 50062]
MDVIRGRSQVAEAVVACFHGQLLFKDLSVELRRAKPLFMNPLHFPERSADDAKKVSEAETTPLNIYGNESKRSATFIKRVNELAEDLNLNHIVAAAFVQEAQRKLPGYEGPLGEDEPDLEVPRLAKQLYFEERRALLLALLELVKGRMDDSYRRCQDTRQRQEGQRRQAGIVAFTDELLTVHDVASKLAKLVTRANRVLTTDAELNKYGPDGRVYFIDERQHLALTLFYIYYQGYREPKTVRELMTVFKETAKLARSDDADDPTFQVAVLLALALVAALDPTSRDMETGGPSMASPSQRTNSLLADEAFGKNMRELLGTASSWEAHTKGLRALVLLAFSLFVTDAKWADHAAQFSAAVADNVFEFARTRILASKLFLEASRDTPFFVSKLDELMMCFLKSKPSQVTQLKQEDEQATRREMTTGGQGGETRHDFEQLLFFLTALYSKWPGALRFWTDRPDVLTSASMNVTIRLHVAYLDFLAALANTPEAAEQAYYFLDSPPNASVGWAHFFEVIKNYEAELRRDDARSHSALAPRVARELHHDDVMGLCAILRLMETVLTHYAEARMAMESSRHWAGLQSLFGLLACQVPAVLKAHLLRVIAAFARSPELCARVWQLVEQAGLLPIPRDGNPNAFMAALEGKPSADVVLIPRGGGREYGTGVMGHEASMAASRALVAGGPPLAGIVFDLEEIEARDEAYPETLAFLLLLTNLIRSGVPQRLGFGMRDPGFLPYFNFVAGHVWLKFDTRGYAFTGQKWEVARAALIVFDRLLSQYVPVESDFLDDATLAAQPEEVSKLRTPGFALMSAMLSGGPFYRKLVSVLEVGVDALEGDRFKAGGEALEACILLCLRIINRTFELEPVFLKFLRSATVLPSAVRLDQSLRQSKKVLGAIANYVSYRHCAELVYNAVKVLQSLSATGVPLVPVLSSLNMADEVALKLVGRLEDGTPEILEPELLHPLLSVPPLASLALNDPFFLLTPDVEGAVVDVEALVSSGLLSADIVAEYYVNRTREAVLELLLVSLNAPYPSMTHLLCGFELERGLAASRLVSIAHNCLNILLQLAADPEFVVYFPTLAEGTARLVHALVSTPATSTATLQLLRSRDVDYFEGAYAVLRTAYTIEPELPDVSAGPVLRLRYTSWILKSIALELHVAGGPNTVHRPQAVRLLTALYSSSEPRQRGEPGALPSFWDAAASAHGEASGVEQARMKLLEVLYSLQEVDEVEPPFPSIPLDEGLVATTISKNAAGVECFDVPALYRVLMAAPHLRAGMMPGTGMSEMGVGDESSDAASVVHQLVAAAADWNGYHERFMARVEVMTAWSQIVLATLARCYELLGSESRESILFMVLDSLLFLLGRGVSAKAVARSMTSVVLAILSKLLQVQVSSRQTTHVPVNHLHALLRGILAALLRHGSDQVQRGNLYAALMAYLQLTQPDVTLSAKHLGEDAGSSLNESAWGEPESRAPAEALASRRSAIASGNAKIVAAAGEALLDVLCRDASHGKQVWQALAFSALNVLVAAVGSGSLLQYMKTHGYLRVFLDDLDKQDSLLSSVLTSSATGTGVELGSAAALRALHVYEAKMALLLRLAGTHNGARALIESGLVHSLISCHFVDYRPEPSVLDTLAPVVVETYHSLLMPVLQLLTALLSSLGSAALDQVVAFLSAHAQLVLLVLKDRAPTVRKESLAEVRMMTALFYALARVNKAKRLEALLPEFGWQFHGHLLALLAKYSVAARWETKLHPSTILEAAARSIRVICRNVIGYCTVVSSPAAGDELPLTASGLLFSPELSGALMGATAAEPVEVPLAIQTRARSPPLATLVIYVSSCALELQTTFTQLDLLERRAGSMAEMEAAEEEAAQALVESMRLKREDIATLWFSLENTLLVLLRHLQWYFELFVPGGAASSSTSLGNGAAGDADSLTVKELAQLASDASACITPVLDSLRKLDSASGSASEFVQFLVRRLREMLRVGVDRHGSALAREEVFSHRRRQEAYPMM